jgi:hypothetical protein
MGLVIEAFNLRTKSTFTVSNTISNDKTFFLTQSKLVQAWRWSNYMQLVFQRQVLDYDVIQPCVSSFKNHLLFGYSAKFDLILTAKCSANLLVVLSSSPTRHCRSRSKPFILRSQHTSLHTCCIRAGGTIQHAAPTRRHAACGLGGYDRGSARNTHKGLWVLHSIQGSHWSEPRYSYVGVISSRPCFARLTRKYLLTGCNWQQGQGLVD